MFTLEQDSSERSWLGVFALSLSAFIFCTTEFLPVGLLKAISDSLKMQPTNVGLMLTIYAWTVALVSLPLTILTRNVERRKLITGIFLVFIGSHIITGGAWNFPVLILGRIGIACAHAMFWSISLSLTVRIAPPEEKSRAIGLLAMGTSIAMVIGIPLGRVISEMMGWRIAFLAIALVAAMLLPILRATLPKLQNLQAGSIQNLIPLLKQPALILLYVMIVLVITGHFTSYTYIEPFIQLVNQASGSRITYILILFGIAGLPAAICFNRLYSDQPRKFLLVSVITVSTCLLILFPSSLNIITLSIHVFIWGGAIVCFGLAIQSWILKFATESTDLAVSIHSGLYNVGIGTGAFLGNHIANDYGLPWIGTFGGVFCGLGSVLCWLAMRIYESKHPTL
ncbi:MAG: sugar transporter [Burkholderia sp.]|nr:sugar transporter [Burkholderia sp.]